MISIRKSVEDLERLEALKKREELPGTVQANTIQPDTIQPAIIQASFYDCYALAIQSSAHYAVEVDLGLAKEYRAHLQLLEEQSRSATSADQLFSVQSSFRGELREYRDKSAEKLKKMRAEIEEATAAMIIFADSVAFNGANHEQEVCAQLQGLESAASSQNIEEIRGVVGKTVAGITSSVEQMQRGNQLVIAQLQDEIRTLHQQMEAERKALFTDRDSGAWNRQKIDTHIDNLLRQNQPFCLLLVWVRNFKRLQSQQSRTVVEGTLKALIARFAALAGDEAVIGRWSEDQFVAVLDVPPGHAVPLSVDATQKLSGAYSVQENGLAHKIVVQATAGVIDRPAGNDASTFHRKLEQLAGAISGA